jgi:ferritin-like metal-binding protein YciE
MKPAAAANECVRSCAQAFGADDMNAVMEIYLTGLRNQHAVETQAIGTIQNELPRMKPYPELHAKMQQDKDQSETQAARLDDLLAKHGSRKSLAKEAITGAVATVAGFAHVTASDEVLKNVLAAVGFKAYEIGSYTVLLALAEAAGATADQAVLELSMKEEQEMGGWLGSHIPDFVHAYLQQKARSPGR